MSDNQNEDKGFLDKALAWGSGLFGISSDEVVEQVSGVTEMFNNLTSDDSGKENLFGKMFSWQGLIGGLLGFLGSKLLNNVFSLFTPKDEATGQRKGLGFLGKSTTTLGMIFAGAAAMSGLLDSNKPQKIQKERLTKTFSQSALQNISQQSGLSQDIVVELASEFSQLSKEVKSDTGRTVSDKNKSLFAEEFTKKHNGEAGQTIQSQQVLAAVNQIERQLQPTM